MYFKTETVVGAFIVLAGTLFIYMSLQLGSVRLNLARYTTYSVEFVSVSNLLPAADVKIAGVKVGWVERVHLQPETMQVMVVFKLLKEYRLYQNATASIRQEGLLGVKFLELVPGTADAPVLQQNGILPLQEHALVSLDELLVTINKLVKQLGSSFEGTNQEAQMLLKSLRERLSNVDSLFKEADTTQQTFREAAQELKKVGTQVTELLAWSEEEEGESPKKKPQGSLGKLLGDRRLYEDIKATSEYARSCVDRAQQVCVGLDSHLEVLPRSQHESSHVPNRTDVKWYGDGYVSTCDGYFGKLGVVSSSLGFAKHRGDDCHADDGFREWGHHNGIRLNLQFGKYWHPYGAVRVGIFEGTAGIGVDGWLAYDRFKWLTTLELFDMRGYNRFNRERCPHLKWLNRLFFTDNVYLTFGGDDLLSRRYRTGFIGIGAYVSMPTLFGDC